MADNKQTRTGRINLPNILTLIRIGLVPPIITLVLIPWRNQGFFNVLTAILFLLAAMTDLFDGVIARNTNQVTDFGKFLDPIADKMLILGTLTAIAGSERFAYIRLIVVISTCIILLRELTVTSIRMVAHSYDGTVIAANFPGKLKTVASVVTVFIILIEGTLFENGLGGIFVLSYIFLIVTVLLTVWSGVIYIQKYFSYIDPRK